MPLKRAALARVACVSLPLALAASVVASGDALADGDKETCVRAVERAQVARLDGKLRKAREGFVICARPVCPAAIREDCTRWVGEVDASLPSVVFEAVWADGHDVTGMTVLVDGLPVANADIGRAVTLDPGEHTFSFEVGGAAPVEQHNVIREGEKNRILRVTFTPSAPAPAETSAAPAPAPAPAPTSAPTAAATAAPANLWTEIPAKDAETPVERRPTPVLAWVLGGVGLASFATFAGLGLDGSGKLDSMRSSCGHVCNPSDVTSARNEILVGDIVGMVGLAATGVAAWLWFTRPGVTVSSR